jgi:DNA (cytosine-5)-methyltransferase 1
MQAVAGCYRLVLLSHPRALPGAYHQRAGHDGINSGDDRKRDAVTYRLLDLFCGAGGAAMGYYRAGFTDITGIDNSPMPRYPFTFIQADALEYLAEHGHEYDVIHASPPCQGYSRMRHLPWLKDRQYPMLIEPVRKLLMKSEAEWVIENSPDAPLQGFVLCGLMFGLPLYRHRRFETSRFMMNPGHPHHTIVIGHGRFVNDRRKGSQNNSSAEGAWGNQKIVTVVGGLYLKHDGEIAMGIDWMAKDELSEAIPPAYTEFIGRQLLGIMRLREDV